MHVKLQTMFSYVMPLTIDALFLHLPSIRSLHPKYNPHARHPPRHHQKLVICDKPADQAPGHPPAQGIALGVPVQDAATGTAALHPVAPSAPPAPYPEEATPFAATGPPQGPRPLYPAPPMDDDDVPPPPDTSVAPPPMQAPPSQASWGPMLQSLTSLTDAVLGRKPSTAVPTADVLAYVGGLDVTLGRYDTPQHALFATLTTTHASDFLNKCLPGSSVAAGGMLGWISTGCVIMFNDILIIMQKDSNNI